MTLPVSFRWDEGFVAAVDLARGDVPRSRWVRVACELRLAESRVNPPLTSPEPVLDVPESRAIVSPSRPESRVEAFRRATQR